MYRDLIVVGPFRTSKGAFSFVGWGEGKNSVKFLNTCVSMSGVSEGHLPSKSMGSVGYYLAFILKKWVFGQVCKAT